MATDGPDPAPCSTEVYLHGQVMFVTDSISSNRMEQWVRAIAAQSGQPVDWHFMGGRAVVKALGDIEKVRSVMDRMFPKLEELRRDSTVSRPERPTGDRSTPSHHSASIESTGE